MASCRHFGRWFALNLFQHCFHITNLVLLRLNLMIILLKTSLPNSVIASGFLFFIITLWFVYLKDLNSLAIIFLHRKFHRRWTYYLNLYLPLTPAARRSASTHCAWKSTSSSPKASSSLSSLHCPDKLESVVPTNIDPHPLAPSHSLSAPPFPSTNSNSVEVDQYKAPAGPSGPLLSVSTDTETEARRKRTRRQKHGRCRKRSRRDRECRRAAHRSGAFGDVERLCALPLSDLLHLNSPINRVRVYWFFVVQYSWVHTVAVEFCVL